MRVLGIESSCDETAAALVTDQGEVLADVVASQIATHGPYGGIVPELASRAHMRAIIPVIHEAFSGIPGGLAGVDAIAVTRGPGLVGSLLVGVQVAKALAWSLDKPLLGVNHLDGHLFAIYLQRPEGREPMPVPKMPYVGLLVSGGHTALYRVEGFSDIGLLAQTRDDAAGEAFDKAAKLLGLGYPGGPIVDRLAALGQADAFSFPLPMASRKTLDFSFSGLKTALARHMQQAGVPKDEQTLANLCASFQSVIVESLVRKSLLACQRERIDQLVITGGVAANRGLRASAKVACDENGITLFVPPPKSCTDNAAMIAMAAVHRLADGERDDLSFAVYSRDPDRRRGKFRADGTLVEHKSE
ncbi:MAG: tRNA (adenosine(37)-N6)-threonylcarbamoyltransferase complex transferase subunit TsaD [Myxococcales bacterium]|nr:tRNA (adenosine(37)-N6)-threonylcarbamoyltransferase complex transferase subunit TsaD [Myxococcales bacterium]MDH3483917.1 tRNA (adenosine(37)-N6)-threonylcarbamoyltransferase complex transferase subunit TsaD [Myxococcales bacterium]